MNSLWLTAVGDSRLHNLKVVRDVLRLLNTDEDQPGAAEATAMLDVFEQEGFALLGEYADDTQREHALELLDRGGCKGETDTTAERLADRALTAAGATPEEVFAANAPGEAGEAVEQPEGSDQPSVEAWQTALVLMASSQGNPLAAAAQAHLLAQSTEDEWWWEVIMALMQSFHFLPDLLIQQGIISRGPR